MGASAAITLSYIGQGPSGQGQIIADQTSGPKSKTLYGYGTLVSGSDATTATVNFIDGTQTLGTTIVLPLQSVEAAQTYKGAVNTALYHSVGADSALAVGDTVVIAGFGTAANNQTAAVVTVVEANRFGVVNSTAVAETNPAATASDSKGGTPVWVQVFYSGVSGSSTTADALFQSGTNKFTASAVSNKTFLLNYPTVTTAGVTINFGCVIAFSS